MSRNESIYTISSCVKFALYTNDVIVPHSLFNIGVKLNQATYRI